MEITSESQVCQICLDSTLDPLKLNGFDSTSQVYGDFNFIMTGFNICLDVSDELTTHLCDACEAQLKSTANFMRQILLSHRKLARTSEAHETGTEAHEYAKVDEEDTNSNYSSGIETLAGSEVSIKPRRKLSLKCEYCEKYFATRELVRSHKKVHTGERKYQCEMCPKRFTQKQALTRHIRCHTGSKPFECHICRKSFRQSSNLNTHMNVHNPKSITCFYCERKFNRKSFLIEHMRIHTQEKAFVCAVCGKTFAREGSWRNHVALHSNKISCQVCGLEYKTKSSLKYHMHLHTGNGSMPHVCASCGLSYDKPSKLLRHVRSKHPELLL